MKKALEYIITSIVDDPKSVEIREEEDNGVVNLFIRAGKDDVGKIIGKEGKIIKAIRNVLKIIAIKENKRIFVSLEE